MHIQIGLISLECYLSTRTPKIKNIKYHTIGKVPKSNRKIVERVKIDTPDMK